MPDREAEEDRQPEQDGHDGDKTELRVPASSTAVDSRLTLEPVLVVGSPDGEGIVLGDLVGSLVRPGGLDHSLQSRGRSRPPEKLEATAPRYFALTTMAITSQTRSERPGPDEVRLLDAAAEGFAEVGLQLAEGVPLAGLLQSLAKATAVATRAEVAVVRIAAATEGWMVSRAVYASSPALRAHIEGSRMRCDELPHAEETELGALPASVRALAERIGAQAALQIPVLLAGEPLASLELLRRGRPFTTAERLVARLGAGQLAFVLRALESEVRGEESNAARRAALELAGDALVAGSEDVHTAEAIVLLGVEASGASACLLWRVVSGSPPVLSASSGPRIRAEQHRSALRCVSSALAQSRSVSLERGVAELPTDAELAVTIRLGRPAAGALQFFFSEENAPSQAEIRSFSLFGVRALHALRSAAQVHRRSAELERTRALLGVIAQAIAELSLAHTLETAIDRVAELLAVERVAVYLQEEHVLHAAASRGVSGPHAVVAERLLELALGPFRGRGLLELPDVAANELLTGVSSETAGAGIEAVLAVPLRSHEDVIGLLAVYPPRGYVVTEEEEALVSALATQLAVAVQNARLHEQATRLGSELEQALVSERQSARQLRALYEISRSFAQSLSLEATLTAVVRTAVELLDCDAAVIRMPDERRDFYVTRAIHVADRHASEALRRLLTRPQPVSKLPGRRLFRMGKPLLLDAGVAASLGSSYELLVPFFERGSTAAVVPLATSDEVLATLTILSLDPARPIEQEKVDLAVSVGGQAALAVDNARLYQQQKGFADTMTRSLLPRSKPELPGLELGAVYEPSARVDVGGDVYDYLELDDGRLAVVLGDVTGHGIEATADMAMTKFVFRSLAREHPEPGDLLASANEVVLDEVPVGNFVTLTYLTIDPGSGAIVCASAGHPPPRLVTPDASVTPLAVGGLALGIESGQAYPEARAVLEPGSSIVLYTDGVVEARRSGELYGLERLDALLAANLHAPPEELAQTVVADCRAFGGGELLDDCAVVVIRRSAR